MQSTSSERDVLINDVRVGKLTPDDAERKARKRGLPPLASVPDAARYDPMKESWWSLPMCLAWIVWRSPDRVRKYWDAYRRKCWCWVPCGFLNLSDGAICEGYDLQRPPAATEALLALAAGVDATTLPPWSTVEDAKESLREVLASGKTQAVGTNIDTRLKEPIPAWFWVDAVWYQERSKTVLRTGGVASNGYCEILVPARALLECWRTAAPSSDQPRRTGMAGRPSSKDLISGELANRARRGELAPTLKAQAKALLEWLAKEHPDDPQPKQASTENAVRREYRDLRATHKIKV